MLKVNKRFVFRQYHTILKATVMCTTKNCAKDLIRFMPSLINHYNRHRTTRLFTNKNYVNIRNLSNSTIGSNTEDFESKIMKLSKSINNDNVNIDILISVVEDLENKNYNILQTLDFMLLQCCGNLMYKHPLKERRELLNRIWNVLKKKKNNLTLNHYHALLQAYIDNNQAIDPSEFLKSMTISPEYNTYYLLLQVPSLDNCTFANNFLLNVKENVSFIDKRIFDTLMYTYAMNGNINGVFKVLNLMKEKKIAPTDINDIYLMYAYAKSGNINELIESLKSRSLSSLHILKLLQYVSLSGNGVYIPKILECLKTLVVEKDAMFVIRQLVCAGHELDACNIITHIPDDKLQGKKEDLTLCLLNELVRLHNDASTLIAVISMLAKENSNVDIWKQTMECVLGTNKKHLLLSMLDKMKAMGLILDSSYFLLLFLHAQRSNSVIDIYSVLTKMSAFTKKIEPEILIKYVFPFSDTTDPHATIEKLGKCGFGAAYTVEPFVKFLLDAGKVNESMKICTVFKKKIDCQNILDSLIANYMKLNDINSCIHILYKLCYNGHGFAGTFIRKLIASPSFCEYNKDDLIKFITATKENKGIISTDDLKYIKQGLLAKNFNNEYIQFLASLLANERNETMNSNTDLYIHPQYMNLDQLREHLHELKSKNKNSRGVIRKLFLKSCNTNNTELVQALILEMKSTNILWTVGMKLCLFDFYVKLKMTAKALAELDDILNKFPQFPIDNFKILRFAILLIEEGEPVQALKMLNNCKYVNHKPDANLHIHNLLCLIVEKNSIDHLKQMIDLLMNRGYCTTKVHLLKYLIAMYLSRGDFDNAIYIFTKCAKQYKKTPLKQELLTALVRAESESRLDGVSKLQKVQNCVISIHGYNTANVNLMIAFALCDQKSQLQHLLQTNTVDEKLILRQFKYLKEDDVVKVTYALLDVVDDKIKMNLQDICKLTLSKLGKRSDCEGAIELKKKMESVSIIPDTTFMQSLDTLLTLHKFPQPLNYNVKSQVGT